MAILCPIAEDRLFQRRGFVRPRRWLRRHRGPQAQPRRRRAVQAGRRRTLTDCPVSWAVRRSAQKSFECRCPGRAVHRVAADR
jgi:hypothetical protein